MTDYKRDSNDDINNDNKEANHLNINNKNTRQYIMAIHLFNKSFIYLLIVKDTLLSSNISQVQCFVFDYYAETVFQNIIPDTGVAKVSIVEKTQFKALQYKILLEIKLNTIRANKSTIYFQTKLILRSIGTV